MRRIRHAAFAFALLAVTLMTACESVQVDRPIGAAPVNLNEVPIEGIWRQLGTDGEFKVTIIDPDKGTALMSWSEEDSEAGWVRHSTELHLRRTGSWIFVSKQVDPEEGEEKGLTDPFEWGRLKLDDDILLLWVPDQDKVADLIRRKTLPGVIRKRKPDNNNPDRDETSEVRLHKLQPEHLKILASEREGVLYEWEDPQIYVRVEAFDRRSNSSSGE